MKLFLLHIRYVKKVGVVLTCVTEAGLVQEVRNSYTPYFYAVNMPVRYRRDIKCTIEESLETKPFIGFTEVEQNVIKMRTHSRHLLTWKNIHETNVPVTRQFCEEFGLNPSCWFDPDTMVKCDNQDDVPNLLLASFDIECYSESGDFPVSETDPITMIATTFQRLCGGPILSHVLSLDCPSSTDPGTVIEQCETEEQLLQRFAEVIAEHNPDVMLGYNIDKFDMRFIHERLSDRVSFYKALSRDPTKPARYSETRFQSAQKGTSYTTRFLIPGRLTLDLLPQVQNHNATLKYDKKYSNLKLDTVCTKEFGAGKTGFTVQEIFDAHRTGDPEQNQRLAEYNIQDCNLVLRLQSKLQVILGIIQLSQISWTLMDDVIHRGQSIRVMNVISKRAHQNGYYLNIKKKRGYKRKRAEEKDAGFQGAHCFEPITGIHTDLVMGVDFASLYPSVIRRYNICPSTLILNSTRHKSTIRTLTDNSTDSCRFVTGTKEAPVPQLCNELGKARTAVKGQMKKLDKNGIKYAVLNKRQMAIKVTTNSVYGFMGASSGGLNHPELAAAVTAYGRDLTRGTAEYVESIGGVVVGGDTDSVYFTHRSVNTLVQSFEFGESVCKAINIKFGFPIILEMEKTYAPMLYLAKKCYAAMMYEYPTDKGTLDVKGIALARGDSSNLTRTLQLNVIHHIMQNPQSPNSGVQQMIKAAIKDVLSDPMKLVKSKKLGADYKNPDGQIQVQVARRMAERGQAVPQVGDRVYYLVAKGKGRICDRADHPDFIEELDEDYYIDSQIFKPLKRILDVLGIVSKPSGL